MTSAGRPRAWADSSRDEVAESGRRDYTDAVLRTGGPAHADRDEHRHETFALAARVVILQVPDVAAHLIQVAGLDLNAVLELDDENDAVLQEDQVGTPAAATGQFELEDEPEAAGLRQAAGKLLAQDADAAMPCEKLGAAGLSGEAREICEKLLVRNCHERRYVARPCEGGFRHAFLS